MTRFPLALLGRAAAIVLGLLCAKPLRHAAVPARITLEPAQLIADGYDTATLTIDDPSTVPPRVTIEPAHAATVTEVSAAAGGWQARIRAGVTAARLTLRVEMAARVVYGLAREGELPALLARARR